MSCTIMEQFDFIFTSVTQCNEIVIEAKQVVCVTQQNVACGAILLCVSVHWCAVKLWLCGIKKGCTGNVVYQESQFFYFIY